MFYETIKALKREAFKRLTGVPPDTFARMLDVLRTNARPFGRPPALSLENQLLVALITKREILALHCTGESTARWLTSAPPTAWERRPSLWERRPSFGRGDRLSHHP